VKAFARTDDPDTSHEAAETVDVSKLQFLVLNAIAQFPEGATAEDVEKALPQHRWNTITPRFAPLMRSGAIVDTGLRRKASTGRSQRVVKFVPEDFRPQGMPKRKRKEWESLSPKEVDDLATKHRISGWFTSFYAEIEDLLKEKNELR
jgi:hypothetical protein